jgi:hypothetical protein
MHVLRRSVETAAETGLSLRIAEKSATRDGAVVRKVWMNDRIRPIEYSTVRYATSKVICRSGCETHG